MYFSQFYSLSNTRCSWLNHDICVKWPRFSFWTNWSIFRKACYELHNTGYHSNCLQLHFKQPVIITQLSRGFLKSQ